VVAAREKELGEKDEETWNAMESLASFQEHLGKSEEASKLRERVALLKKQKEEDEQEEDEEEEETS